MGLMEAACRRTDVSSVLVALNDDGANIIYTRREERLQEKGDFKCSGRWNELAAAVADYNAEARLFFGKPWESLRKCKNRSSALERDGGEANRNAKGLLTMSKVERICDGR